VRPSLVLVLALGCAGPDPGDTADTGAPVDTDEPVDTDDTDDPGDTDDTDDPGDTDDTDDPEDTGDTDDPGDTDPPVDEPCEPADPPLRWSVEARSVLLGPTDAPEGIPWTTHIESVRLLGDGPQVLVSDGLRNAVTWVGDCIGTACTTRDLPTGVDDPTRTTVVDLDEDGARDVVVVGTGDVFPTPEAVGVIEVLWGDGAGGFTAEVLLERVGRTSCVEPADLDGDKDLDLIVCEFGVDGTGSLYWLEQTPTGWEREPLTDRDGPIDAWAEDLNGDGHLDVISNLSQTVETVVVFLGDGLGGFLPAPDAFVAPETWHGSAGLRLVDLDGDGDLDAVFTNGDSLDGDLPLRVHPEEHYGVAWLENRLADEGDWVRHDILRQWGAYTTRAVDLDRDCDVDLAMASFQDPNALIAHVDDDPDFVDTLVRRPVVWLENDGEESFTRHVLEGFTPSSAFALEVVDLDDDGVLDIVSGPFDVMGTAADEPRVFWYRGRLDPR
jgi:hypothetical protein